MTTSKSRTDRRIQRTRQMLQRAFIEVVREKGFKATSIQDITERANVNRGTFYLHFADKYMLVDALIREDFQHLLEDTLPPTSRWDRSTLRLLIQAILDRFEKKYRHQRHVPRAVAPFIEVNPLIEHIMHEELTRVLLTWLKQSKGNEIQWLISEETIARVVSWAIFGTAIEWSQEETSISLEQMTDTMLLVVMEGVAHLAPDTFPDSRSTAR